MPAHPCPARCQVILPPGYLAGVYGEMRAAGAACVADEVQVRLASGAPQAGPGGGSRACTGVTAVDAARAVQRSLHLTPLPRTQPPTLPAPPALPGAAQCGFGRVGAAFWAFRLQGVVPDIVTWGKPAGNGGNRLAAVWMARASGWEQGLRRGPAAAAALRPRAGWPAAVPHAPRLPAPPPRPAGFPLSGLVTSRRLADTFAASGMEYFATFGQFCVPVWAASDFLAAGSKSGAWWAATPAAL